MTLSPAFKNSLASAYPIPEFYKYEKRKGASKISENCEEV